MNAAKAIQNIVDTLRSDFRPVLSDDSINIFLTIALEPNLHPVDLASKLDLIKPEIDVAIAGLMTVFSVRFSTVGLIFMNQDGSLEATETGKKISQGLFNFYAA